MFRPLLAAALLALAAGPAGARQLEAEPAGAFAEPSVAAGAPSGSGRAPLKIGGGGVRVGESQADRPEPRGSSAWGVAGALALVLGLFAAGAKWFGGSKLAGGPAGGGACEVLARVKLEPRASMHVVRVGGRVVLIGSAADGLTSLGEIDDPVEAEVLAASCRADADRSRPRPAAAAQESFRTVFGRAAARSSESADPNTLPMPAAAPESGPSAAERRLAARLRPAGANR